jgi:hypothetical protein
MKIKIKEGMVTMTMARKNKPMAIVLSIFFVATVFMAGGYIGHIIAQSMF